MVLGLSNNSTKTCLQINFYTPISLASLVWDIGKHINKVESNKGLHCFPVGVSIET